MEMSNKELNIHFFLRSDLIYEDATDTGSIVDSRAGDVQNIASKDNTLS
jgi:hypothetical protein